MPWGRGPSKKLRVFDVPCKGVIGLLQGCIRDPVLNSKGMCIMQLRFYTRSLDGGGVAGPSKKNVYWA